VRAVATGTLLALVVAGFLLQLMVGHGGVYVPVNLAFVPGLLFGGAALPAGTPVLPPPATFVTYQFLHSGWLHLAGNVLTLWVFGPPVESRIGAGRFTTLMILGGIAAALGQAWRDPSSAVPMIGASGGISAVLGAFLLLWPGARLRLMLPWFGKGRPLTLPAWLVLLAWLGAQIALAVVGNGNLGGIAFGAHVAGFMAGLLLLPMLNFRALLSVKA
jgi:membrane associated rhomboid family serine protease